MDEPPRTGVNRAVDELTWAICGAAFGEIESGYRSARTGIRQELTTSFERVPVGVVQP